MPANDRLLGKVPSAVNASKAYGVNVTPGPYIGLVKNNVDPTRAGRLRVFIPDFGGSETEEAQWITVSYASPFMGATRWPRVREEKSENNFYENVNHSYGMWMTPPDIGNSILVIFVGGDIKAGYWFACIFPELTHYAIPGGAGSMYMEPKTTVDKGLAAALTTKPYPVTEFNEVNQGLWPKWSEFLTIPKPAHEEQCLRLLKEGLEDDKIRGVITSSSQRESPSRVFGISTPGPESPSKMPDPNNVDGPQYRLGGHTFVMDDGDTKNKNRIIRLRTSSGHQIMMSDTDDFIYVANAQGTAWFEMTKEGKFYFYGKDSISFRTEKDFNVHADHEINFFAKNSMNVFANTSIVHESPGQITLRADTELNQFGGMVGIKSSGKMVLQSDTFMSQKVGTSLTVSAGGAITLKSDSSINTQSSSDTTILAGGAVTLTGSTVNINGPAAPSVGTAKEFKKPAPLKRIIHIDPEPTMPAPYYKWIPKVQFTSTLPIVPTHEPYGPPKKSPARHECCDNNDAGVVEEGKQNPTLHGVSTKPIFRLTDV